MLQPPVTYALHCTCPDAAGCAAGHKLARTARLATTASLELTTS